MQMPNLDYSGAPSLSGFVPLHMYMSNIQNSGEAALLLSTRSSDAFKHLSRAYKHFHCPSFC